MIDGLSGTTKMFGGFAILGIIGAFWSHIKVILNKISSLLIVSTELEAEGVEALISYLRENGKFCKLGIRRFEMRSVYVKSISRFRRAFCEMIGNDPAIYLSKRKENGWNIWPIMIGSPTTGEKHKPGSALFIRGTFNIDDLVYKASEHYNNLWEKLGVDKAGNRNASRFYIEHVFGSLAEFQSNIGRNGSEPEQVEPASYTWYNARNIKMGTWRVIGYDVDDIGQESNKDGKEIDYLSYPPEIKALIDKILMWSKSRDWFKNKNLCWKMGVFLSGLTGSGKSAFAKAIAEMLDFPLFRYDLTTMKNSDLNAKWHKMLHSSPCVALFEDIDTIFSGRTNIFHKQTVETCLTFDCLLNTLEGVEDNDGVLTIMTGNNIDNMDSAIGRPRVEEMEENMVYNSTRPGRIDLVANFGRMDEDCRRELANRIMKDLFDKDTIERLVKECEGYSPSQFSDKCKNLSLKKFWDNNVIDIKSCGRNVTNHQERKVCV